MILNIKKLSEILGEKLSLSQRGILITIMLVRDNDPKLTLAKFKASVKMNEAKQDLIHLHKVGLITWSGYNNALKSLSESEDLVYVKEVLDFMNAVCSRNYNYLTKGHNKEIIARLKEYPVDSLKLVVSNRYEEWKDDSYMNKYLRPSTLFNASKFPIYLEEAQRTKKGEGILNAAKIGLNDGDTITLALSKTLSQKESYKIVSFVLDDFGKRLGNGVSSNKLGEDIFRSLLVQENNLEYAPRGWEYVYKQK